MARKKKAVAALGVKAASLARAARLAEKEERRRARLAKKGFSAKKEHRKRDRKLYTADQWAVPAPSHLVARLEVPKHKSKYHSYFEFAENTEKKKRLEFKVTDDSNPPPGFKFVPVGHPALTNACKELSRERDAMIFIVSGSKEENSKISEHIYRTGYHFRESIVDEALDLVGETTFSIAAGGTKNPEPIPESQEDINKQADGAIRDLFPRIPNTDRQMIIEHAFQKGAMFHGEPTVGLQPDIPLSRRVQLAVLAHIRHTHTRYDQLLKETSWMNARKAVEPVCLDFIVKWRGDEETGRDQMDEILREVVIITDSEESDESSEEDSSDEEGEVSSSSSESIPELTSGNQNRPPSGPNRLAPGLTAQRNCTLERGITALDNISLSEQQPKTSTNAQTDKRTQRGFKRYQAAWDDAIHRQHALEVAHADASYEGPTPRARQHDVPSPRHKYPMQTTAEIRSATYTGSEQARFSDPPNTRRLDSRYLQQRTAPETFPPDRNEVITRPQITNSTYYQDASPRLGHSPQQARDYALPPLVRRPPSRGLQDMLVPSIETGSSDALVELPREFIMISDDSPRPKRRRVVHDDTGHFKPLPFYDQVVYSAPPHSESHSIPVSSTQPRDFFVQSPRNPGQSSQGLLRDTHQSFANRSGDKIPIYDAPVEAGFAPAISSKRAEFGVGSGNQREVSRRQMSPPRPLPDRGRENIYIRRPIAEDARMVDQGQVVRLKEPDFDPRNQNHRPSSPCFPVTSRVSRSYEVGPSPVYAEQAPMRNSSHSRLEPPLPKPRHNTQPYESILAGSYAAVRHVQDRSPVQYMERPMYRPDTVLHGQERARVYDERYTMEQPMRVVRERPPPQAADVGPTFVRAVPRREIITLD